jgi:hypothetical protein
MSNLFIKTWLLLRDFLVFYYSNEYQLKLENYYYCDKQESYLLMFRVRGKGVFKTLNIEQVCNDKDLLAMIHPVDSYIAGIIYGMQKNKIIFESNIMTHFSDYSSYVIIEPFLDVQGHQMDDEDFILLRGKNNQELFNVPILDFCDKPFLLHAVGSVASNQFGFFMSEKFIAKIN